MTDFLQLDQKHILVTGATSGIGRATAILASRYGARVTIIGRRENRLQEALSEMKGEGHLAVPFDVSDIDRIEDTMKTIIERNGPIDGYVHSAGTNKDSPINSVKYEKILDLMRVNFHSFYEIVRIISRKGRFNPGLSIVGVSSISARCGSVSQTAYSSTKAAMNGAMRAMARELAPKGIRVNTVLPGPTDTEMYRDYLALKADVKQTEAVKPSGGRNYLGINESTDVANAIVFLLSQASRMITGVELPVDGGFTSC